VLGRQDVTENDVDEYIQKINVIIREIVDLKIIKLNLTRCDYCIDVKISSNKELQEIFKLLNKHHSQFKYIKANQIYEDSRYLCKPNSSININIYDKFSQLLNIYGYEDENYRNVIRVELQLKKKKIQRLNNAENLKRNIREYWCQETMQKQYINYLHQYLYEGDYYKLSKAKSIIISSSYSKTIKNNLIKFLEDINTRGITEASNKKSYNSAKKYINFLNSLKINPITLNEDSQFNYIENLLTRVIKVAEDTKFKKNKDLKKERILKNE
jgi:hypothetical protein